MPPSGLSVTAGWTSTPCPGAIVTANRGTRVGKDEDRLGPGELVADAPTRTEAEREPGSPRLTGGRLVETPVDGEPALRPEHQWIRPVPPITMQDPGQG